MGANVLNRPGNGFVSIACDVTANLAIFCTECIWQTISQDIVNLLHLLEALLLLNTAVLS